MFKNINSSVLVVLVTLFILLTGNAAFFDNVLNVYPLSVGDGFYLFSVFIVFCGLTVMLSSLFCCHTITLLFAMLNVVMTVC